MAVDYRPDIEPSNVRPSMGTYNTPQTFRFWCQKVLPLVYDDSLSYYELLCKVVDYLNKTMEDVNTAVEDVTNLNSAFGSLENHVNASETALLQAYTDLQTYVNNYFDNLDVQEEINNKLDAMVADGTMDTIILPYFNEYVEDANNRINEFEEQAHENINNAIYNQDNIISNHGQRINVLQSEFDNIIQLQTEGTMQGSRLVRFKSANRLQYTASSGSQSFAFIDYAGQQNTTPSMSEIDAMINPAVVSCGVYVLDAQDDSITGKTLYIELGHNVKFYPSGGYLQAATDKRAILFDIPYNASDLTSLTNKWLEFDFIIACEISTDTSEITDIRIGANGYAYSTAGNAVRGQISDVEELCGTEKINLINGLPIQGGYRSYESGRYADNPDWSYYPVIFVEPNTYYKASYNGAHVAFFDGSGEFISGVLVNNTVSNFDFITPNDVVYMSYSYLTSSGDQYILKSLDYENEYINSVYKKLKNNIMTDITHFSTIYKTGKNLFNKHNLIDGYAMDYVNGARIWRNASYCFCPNSIPCKPNTTYHYNAACIISEYDINGKYLTVHNFSASPNGTFTTLANTEYLKIATLITRKNILQVEEGSVGTEYEMFKLINKYDNIITVRQDGFGDCASITDAVNMSGTNDIILVYPGTYEESIKTYSKRVNILGLDKEKCILTYSALDYSNPPLEIAKGSVKNITIKATNTGTSGQYNAYCVHIDNDNEANESLLFDNVGFINEVHQCVGVGLRANFVLTFNNCSFVANDQAALYCHDWETSDTSADKTGQKLIVKNCTLINSSNSRATIMLQSQELVEGGAECLFLSNVVVNKTDKDRLVSMTLWAGRTLTNNNYLGSSDWILSDLSGLNNIDIINQPTYVEYDSGTVIYNRVKDVSGGYKRINNIVYINLKFTGNASASNTPNLIGGLPKPINTNAILSCIKANNLDVGVDESAIAIIHNTYLQMKSIATDNVYYVTGSYICE